MILEKQFEDIICKYPDIIEEGLIFQGRQVRVYGKIIDILLEDRFGDKLIVELKRGTIKRKNIGQVMDYEGRVLSIEDPAVRIMLVGNRVPPNFQKSLDHHGIEWKEITLAQLKKILEEKNDQELLEMLRKEELSPQLAGLAIEDEIKEKTNQNEVENINRNENSSLWHEFWVRLMQKLSAKSIFKGKKAPYWAGFWASYKKLDFGFHLAQSHADVIFKIGIKENKELNKKIFNKLYSQRTEIEKALGEHLIWDEMKRRCSSKIYKRFSFQELSNKENWNKLQANMADIMEKYEKVFKYYIDQLFEIN
ncbi:MAG: DUF4268 domain-containing protein [Candidatus Omnitrophica bacterium]|nr:DUF4268 domain-containing protein [Candidatus Omnitrophota bacterium]